MRDAVGCDKPQILTKTVASTDLTLRSKYRLESDRVGIGVASLANFGRQAHHKLHFGVWVKLHTTGITLPVLWVIDCSGRHVSCLTARGSLWLCAGCTETYRMPHAGPNDVWQMHTFRGVGLLHDTRRLHLPIVFATISNHRYVEQVADVCSRITFSPCIIGDRPASTSVQLWPGTVL